MTCKSSPTTFQSLEIFAGAGGMALGIHNAGFQHLALVEWDQHAVETLRKNSLTVLDRDPAYIISSDVSLFDFKSYLGSVDLLSGGPPCQPFSAGGRSRGPDDERDMFPVMADVVGDILPRAVLVENVRGLLRDNFATYFDYITHRLSYPLFKMRDGETWVEHYQRLLKTSPAEFNDDEQYLVDYQLVDAADFGIPQRRYRVIINAFRRDLGYEPIQLAPTHSRKALLKTQWITEEYWDRHGIEPVDYLTPSDKKLLADLIKSPDGPWDALSPWRTVRDAIGGLPAPVPRGQPEVVPNHTQHPGARVYKGHIGSHWDYPSKTLKAGMNGTPGGENTLRVTSNGNEVRYYTIREAGRLHTFPDEWHFVGTWGACIKQLGNAVPVKLAQAYASRIRERIEPVHAVTQ